MLKEKSRSTYEIDRKYGHMIKSQIGKVLSNVDDFRYLASNGSKRFGVWYIIGREEQAKKDLEEKIEAKRALNELSLPFNYSLKSPLELFENDKDEHALPYIWAAMGGSYPEIVKDLNRCVRRKFLLVKKQGSMPIYRRNPNYALLCGEES